MSFSRNDLQDAVNRAGEEHMQRLRKHHEDAYPESRPTPGAICEGEAERLNDLGLGEDGDFELLETRVERTPDDEVTLTHVFRYGPLDVRLLTEPYTNYG